MNIIDTGTPAEMELRGREINPESRYEGDLIYIKKNSYFVTDL